MTLLAKVATLTLSAATLGAAFAQTSDGVPPVVCKVSGYDVIVSNAGDVPIAAGTRITWSVRFARRQGEYALASDLQPGISVFLSGALGSNFLDSDRPCTASIG